MPSSGMPSVAVTTGEVRTGRPCEVPAAPEQLQVQSRTDGSVVLSWHSSAKSPSAIVTGTSSSRDIITDIVPTFRLS